MKTLPAEIYSVEQIRQLEKAAVSSGISEHELMQRAGQAAFDLLRKQWPQAHNIIIVCGSGNNGGDGYVLASLAKQANLNPSVIQLCEISKLQGPALAAAQACEKCNVAMELYSEQQEFHADVIVDAVFGIGLEREVQGKYLDVIHAINHSSAPKLAIDIPSGVHADSGKAFGAAVSAQHTITFIGLKLGLLTAKGCDYAGVIHCEDLKIPQQLFARIAPMVNRLVWERLQTAFSPRKTSANKGSFGHVLIIGGDHGMAGAVRMAAEACLRVGAGLVSVATRQEHVAIVSTARPEIMCHGIHKPQQLNHLIAKATVIVIGPGLGRSAWSSSLFKKALTVDDKPLVVDADGLNFLAKRPAKKANWVLTPHPGEASRLLHSQVQEVKDNSLQSVQAIQNDFSGVAILKGAGTLIYDGEKTYCCTNGNPGMATAGMGDILSGVIAGLLAQGFDLSFAARVGVCLHAKAADKAALEGERGMIATDLLPYLRELCL